MQKSPQRDKFGVATEGMQRECYNRLVSMKNKENARIIADYLIAYKSETDTTDWTRAINCLNIIRFTEGVNKSLKAITRDDIQQYFNRLRKPEDDDSKHKWKGTWNLLRIRGPIVLLFLFLFLSLLLLWLSEASLQFFSFVSYRYFFSKGN